MVFRKLGFNEYKIIDDYAIIYITRNNGDKFVTIVDANDIPYLIDLDYRWHVTFDQHCKQYRVMTCYYYEDFGIRKHTNIMLNDIIMRSPKGIPTDHINHDPLDNRKNNLRVISRKANEKNRKGKNSNNKIGHRNICQVGNKLWVQLYIDGKNVKLKTFNVDELDEAILFAKEMREKYYGKYAGEG